MSKTRTLFILLISLSAMGYARIVHVAPPPLGATSGNGSSGAPYDSVKRGIAEAVDGDTVLLEDGRYHEHNIHLYSKKIVLGSRFVLNGDTDHVKTTIIDGDSTNSDSGSVFAIIHPSDTETVFIGFTISRGTGTGYSLPNKDGGGIFFVDTNNFGIKMNDMRIINNTVYGNGGGLSK